MYFPLPKLLVTGMREHKRMKPADKESRSILQNHVKHHTTVKGTDVDYIRAMQTLNASLKDSNHDDLSSLFEEHKSTHLYLPSQLKNSHH